MLINEFFSKDPDIVLDITYLIILDRKSAVCMANNVKDNNHTWHIYRRVHLVRNGEKCKMPKIDWCEGGMKLSVIATKNIGENELNNRMKYIIVRLEK